MTTGKKVMTRGIANKIAENGVFALQVSDFFGAFLKKDWGDISKDDKEINDQNAESGIGTLMGAYETCEGRIWIMTEHDRSVTTILFPHEY